MQSVRLAFLDKQRPIHGEDANVARVHLAAFPYHHGAAIGIGRLHAVAVDMEQDVRFAQLRCIVNVARLMVTAADRAAATCRRWGCGGCAVMMGIKKALLLMDVSSSAFLIYGAPSVLRYLSGVTPVACLKARIKFRLPP